jgi:hypothetical protein
VRTATSSTTGGGIGAPPLYVRRSDERSCAAAASSLPVAMYAVIVTVTPSCSVSLVATTGSEVVREAERRAGGERQADVAAQARHVVERCDAEHAVLAPRPASRDIGAAPLGGPVVTDIPEPRSISLDCQRPRLARAPRDGGETGYYASRGGASPMRSCVDAGSRARWQGSTWRRRCFSFE